MTTVAEAADVQGEAPSRFFTRMFWVFVALGLFTAGISLAGRGFSARIMLGGNSDSRSVNEIVVANSVFGVPENYIRNATQRTPGVVERLDLYALWPEMAGYDRSRHVAFDNQDATKARLIFITLEAQQMSRDMSGRLEPIYRELIDPIATPTEIDGLQTYGFRKDRVIFNNELLYVGERTGDRPFVARCIAGAAAADALAPCERDVYVGDNLAVKYRFPAALLSDFRNLDQRVLRLVDSFSTQDRKG